jgi:hypothetical protein
MTACPTKQEWFLCILRGCKIRMGFTIKLNQSLTTSTITKLLALLKRESKVEPQNIAWEYIKVKAAIALAVCALLRGPEVFLLDLAGLRRNIDKGKNGILPPLPLKASVDLTEAPHVIVALLRNFKGKTGMHQHMIALASTITSGITLRWWLEQLVEVQAEEGCSHGPAFGYSNGLVATLHKYDGILHHFLQMIQQENPEMIAEDDDVQSNYGFFCTFRKSLEAKARAAGRDSSTLNAMNRWRTIENAKGGCPCFDMIEYYSNA